MVMTQDGEESLARIPGALAHRSATPIRANDIVILLPWDFDSRSGSKRRYEIFAVIHDRKEICEHIREGRIPGWMLDDTKSKHEDLGVEFDYETKHIDDTDGNNEDEVNINNI